MSISRIESKPFNKDFATQIWHVDISKYYASLVLVRDKWRDLFNSIFKDCCEDEDRLEKLRNIIEAQVKGLLDGANRISADPYI